MNKSDLIEQIVNDAGISRPRAHQAFDSLISGIESSLLSSEKATIAGFGSFEIKERKGKTGRNPKTGEKVEVPPKNFVKFTASKSLNITINNSKINAQKAGL